MKLGFFATGILQQLELAEFAQWGGEHRLSGDGCPPRLPPTLADAALLELKRGHWRVENDLHRSKDVTLGEDASLIHRGSGPDVMALLRTLAVSLLHAAGISTIAAQLRLFSSHPAEVVAFVTNLSLQNA